MGALWNAVESAARALRGLAGGEEAMRPLNSAALEKLFAGVRRFSKALPETAEEAVDSLKLPDRLPTVENAQQIISPRFSAVNDIAKVDYGVVDAGSDEAQIFKKAKAATVRIRAPKDQSGGTGFIIDKCGIIATDHHVVFDSYSGFMPIKPHLRTFSIDIPGFGSVWMVAGRR